MSNMNTAKERALGAMVTLRRWLILPLILALSYFFMVPLGGFYMGYESGTMFFTGPQIVSVTGTSTTQRVVGSKQNCRTPSHCEKVDDVATVQQINLIWSAGTGANEKVDNQDNNLYLKYDTNDVGAIATTLGGRFANNGNSLGIAYVTGIRQGLPDWIMRGGINRNMVELYEYRPEMSPAEYKALSSKQRAQIVIEKPGFFSYSGSVWLGFLLTGFLYVQYFCMLFGAAIWTRSGKLRWGLLMGPVGFWIPLLVRLFLPKKKAKTPAE